MTDLAVTDVAVTDPSPDTLPAGMRRSRRAVAGLGAATLLSVTGNGMVAVVVPLLVLTRTGSPAAAGLVASAALAAMVPALLVGGALIDRWGRRRVSLGADLLSAASVAALPVVDHLVGLTLVTTIALVALGAAFDGPGGAAREALRPDAARAGGVRLERVNARGEAMDGLGSVVGPALAGIGTATVGGTTTLWAAAVMLLGAAAVTAALVPDDRAAARPRPRDARPEPYLAATLTGLRHVWTDRTLRALGLAGLLAMIFVAPLVLTLTSLAERSGNPDRAGLLVAALAGGLVVGALGYGALAPRLRRRTVLLTAMTLASLALLGLSVTSGPLLPAVPAALAGLAFGPVTPIFSVVAQDRAPDHLRGRVIGALGAVTLLASPLGTLAAGALLQAAGPSATFAVIGVGCLLTTAYLALTPGLRRIERHHLTDAPTDAPTTDQPSDPKEAS